MIKFVALLTMLVDHIGLVVFPEKLIFRIIGRISMPLFAYCIARGFYYSKKHGTVHNYLLYMLAFALISQLPYSLMLGSGLNIGFTWLLSLLLLYVFTCKSLPGKSVAGFLLLILLFCATERLNLLPCDYGFYGVVTPLLFYMLIVSGKESTSLYMLVLVAAWALYVYLNQGSMGSMAQVFSVVAASVLTFTRKHDAKIKLPKWLFYAFYPVHMAVLALVFYY